MTEPSGLPAPPGEPGPPPGPLYQGTGIPLPSPARLPDPPPWRTFHGGPGLPAPPDDEAEANRRLGAVDPVRSAVGSCPPASGEIQFVNAALLLRKPLLITGPPGIGKSAVAFRLARELRLGRVLHWTVTSTATLRDALYSVTPTGNGSEVRVRLGPVGTAFLPRREPRVLLVEGLDRGHFDLPVELRGLLRRGGFEIPELGADGASVGTDDPGPDVPVGQLVECRQLPVLIVTAGPSRLFAPEFLADCLQWEYSVPTADELRALVRAHTGITADTDPRIGRLVEELIAGYPAGVAAFGPLPVEQLLDAVSLAVSGQWLPGDSIDDAAAGLLALLQGRSSAVGS